MSRARLLTCVILATAAAAACILGSIILADGSTSLPIQSRVWQYDPSAEPVSITAADGAILRAACFHPLSDEPRGAVIVLHGVGDHGYSMTGLANLLTAQGYIVLAPDSRAHGGSGGERITYGVLERHDIARWIAWLDENYHPQAFYGYGASLGGATLIQSLNEVKPRFHAIVAECPFANFHTVAYDRLSQIVGVPRPFFAPVVEPALLYARMRYGVDLDEANPEEVLRDSQTPVLLIHGTADANIPISHSRRLHAANPKFTELWEIEGAHHVDAWHRAGREFERRVIAWFASH
ncbi:MAG TPA: alpha/beta fold hydrolase [Bryobacteraceae bacterium]|jgi:hypothetical protein